MYAPGFNFWEEGTNAESMCSLASTTCYVQYETDIQGNKRAGDLKKIQACKEECLLGDPFLCRCRAEDYPSECVNDDGTIKESWKKKVESLCVALGDCGVKDNYLGYDGYSNWDESFVRSKLEEKE